MRISDWSSDVCSSDLPRARLHAYLTASFRPPVTDPDLLGAWTAFWALARSDARMAAIHAESYAGYRTRLGELLVASGSAAAERLAILLTAMVDGLWRELSLDSASLRVEVAGEMVERAGEVLRAYAVPPRRAEEG